MLMFFLFFHFRENLDGEYVTIGVSHIEVFAGKLWKLFIKKKHSAILITATN